MVVQLFCHHVICEINSTYDSLLDRHLLQLQSKSRFRIHVLWRDGFVARLLDGLFVRRTVFL